jgi:hypothetical protein
MDATTTLAHLYFVRNNASIVFTNGNSSTLNNVSVVISGQLSSAITDPGLFIPEPIDFFKQFDLPDLTPNSTQNLVTTLPANADLTITIALKQGIDSPTIFIRRSIKTNDKSDQMFNIRL